VTKANVEFLREGYEALQRGDLETFTALSRERLAPEFEFHHVWDGRVFRGFEGTMEWISDTRETWDEYSQEIVRISGRGGGSGVPVAQELAVVWTFEGDKAVQARSFTSRDEAFEAATQLTSSLCGQAISSVVYRASVSKSASACNSARPLRMATLAIRQSVSARTVCPARRHAR
jgi:ketosteroid isomerase-like protein